MFAVCEKVKRGWKMWSCSCEFLGDPDESLKSMTKASIEWYSNAFLIYTVVRNMLMPYTRSARATSSATP